MKRPTHSEAFAALCDPKVDPETALRLFIRAYSRSNDATKGFVLAIADSLRSHKQKRPRHPVKGSAA